MWSDGSEQSLQKADKLATDMISLWMSTYGQVQPTTKDPEDLQIILKSLDPMPRSMQIGETGVTTRQPATYPGDVEAYKKLYVMVLKTMLTMEQVKPLDQRMPPGDMRRKAAEAMGVTAIPPKSGTGKKQVVHGGQ